MKDTKSEDVQEEAGGIGNFCTKGDPLPHATLISGSDRTRIPILHDRIDLRIRMRHRKIQHDG